MKPTTVETIYRAKKIDSDEYVEGMLFTECNRLDDVLHYFICDKQTFSVEVNADLIDESTLAIHFTNSNMTDSEGTAIFASLSSDGNGGDSLQSYMDDDGDTYPCFMKNGGATVYFPFGRSYTRITGYSDYAVAGIHTAKGDSDE